ncbi:unnamed protein product, partial [Meganyctiphanes norvegica]
MAESGLLVLKWDHYRNNFSEILCNVKKKESYSDVTISCEGKLYRVHRLVLSMCSDYMDKLFQELESSNSFTSNLVVVLKDIKGKELEKLLDFIYIGEAQVLQCDLPDLIKAAEYLGIKGFSKSKESDSVESLYLDSSKVDERPTGGKRPTENSKDFENFNKSRDDRIEIEPDPMSKESENVLSHDTGKHQWPHHVNSPICSNDEDNETLFNDLVSEEMTESNQDTEISSHGPITNENSNTLSEPNDPLDFEKIKRDNEEDDDSSDIIIEEDITPAIIPHFKPMDPQPGMVQDSPVLNSGNQYQNNPNFPGAYGLQWMDFDGGHSIPTNMPSNSNASLHSNEQ